MTVNHIGLCEDQTVTTEDFFEERTDQSAAKAEIVRKYFGAWANIIIRAQKTHGGDCIAYVDLFCGPGRYQDGSVSTPIKILQEATQSEDMRERLVSLFNDKNSGYAQALREEIDRIPNISSLRHTPQVYSEEVDERIAARLEARNLVPTLLFVDPWGYKGLSRRLLSSVLKDWGSDCVFFFNYNRISPGLSNPSVRDHMEALFGSR
jgi:three-Cys-motif partner protein